MKVEALHLKLKQENTLSINKNYYLTCIIMIGVLFVLGILFPYTHDDWDWGSQLGLERLKMGFVNYNGRYFGNIIVLILTRSLLLRSFIVAITLVGIAHQISSFVNKYVNRTLILALTLILLLPPRVGAQAIVWTSGFTNYAIPTFLTLVYLNVCRESLFTNSSIDYSKFRLFSMLLLGIGNSLIMENVTIFNPKFQVT